MHAALFLLASVLPGDNPVHALDDIIAPPGPLELRGRWEGYWTREGDSDFGVVFQDGRLTLPMTPAWTERLTLIDEGHGRFRGRFADVDVLGIYSRQDERIVLCWRGADRGRPTRFRDEDCADVLILRRVRAGR
jgi:hypothetical protein